MADEVEQHELDFTREPDPEGPMAPPSEGGAEPTLPLQTQKWIKAVNACDFEHNDARVPDHPYSRLCDCDRCQPQHQKEQNEQLPFIPPETVVYHTYTAKQLIFRTILECDAKNFILPRNYLRRWFVGATVSFGAFSPDGHLVAAMVISAPNAYSKRFTSKNCTEVRRFVMLDCCGPNSESRFIAWCLRWIHRHMPHLKYVITFGDPVFDRETPYKAAGFVFDGTSDCGAQWISHKGRRSREAPRPKHRFVYRFDK